MKKMNKVNYLLSTAVGAFFSFFGALAIPLLLLVPCNIIDYFTGMAASKVAGKKIESKISYQGIVKKVTMYVLIFVGFGIDCMISYVTSTLHVEMVFPLLVSAIIASWLVVNELISITENCEKIGVYVPILAPILKFVKKKIEDTAAVEEEIKKE